MIPKLISADYAGGYSISLCFADGLAAEADLSAELWGDVFEDLQDPSKFGAFTFSQELNTIVWPSGADFAPEFLYELAAAEHL